ncbi:uncharacterized protein LOC127853683 isoform X2 [Dreissena polymorpha]|uniref:uncharacterized protein LOC127853683 isoform X2 n=2 Tax=Dreissena polymorpha TaxID=45954 RepID=UPI0022644454|nr:uncharacterized protein LOC127853683 isoform X2 [Dreissena polymorpha]
MSCFGIERNNAEGKVGWDDGRALRRHLVRTMMDYHSISSYRAIIASTTAIINPQKRQHALQESSGGDSGNTRGDNSYTVFDRREYLVKELLATEREYLRRLQHVLENYAEPFRKFTSLTVEEHKVLFVSLEPIISLSAMVASKLGDAVEHWDTTSTKIGNSFPKQLWNHYSDYAKQYTNAIKPTLDEKYDDDESFVEFLKLRRGSSELTLENLLQLPVQRIPEYDKYLNELLQETDPGHPDYDHLSRAAAKVRQMVKEREDELENMDNMRRMERVQYKFPHDDLQLQNIERRHLSARRKSAPGAVLFRGSIKPKSSNNILSSNSMGKKDPEIFQYNNFNRQYLMEGNVEFSRGMQTQDRYMFLFSDLLLVAKQKSNTKFKLKHRLPLGELWVAYCIDEVTELTLTQEHSFVIGWPTTNYVATFQSVELKDTWLVKFKEQIEEERSKLKPETLPLEVHHKKNEKTCHIDVERTTDVQTVIAQCLQQLSIPEDQAKDFQLWCRMGPDESPYPLCGHELPYAIKMSQIRDFVKHKDFNMPPNEIQRIVEEMTENNHKNEFFLKTKKSQKRHSLEETTATKPTKTKRKFTIFRKNREDKKPQPQLFGRNLTDVTSPECLIAKPVKELLTILFREGPYTVGILRKSCNAKLAKDLRQKLDDGEDCINSETWPALVVGSILKDYLRCIPKSLLREELFDDWIAANSLDDPAEKTNKLKDTISKLPATNRELLRHFMCVLYHIDKKSEENKMTAYNLSVCIAPSLLWPKGNNDPLATPPAVLQFMIEHCATVFGEDTVHLFGDNVEQKMRQDSSTDSDSMHSVLSSHSNFRRDDSSIDSLDHEVLYGREIDSSPSALKSHHFSPSNLSGDSGLISDSQYCDEDGNGNEISNMRSYNRSNSDFLQRDISNEDELETASHSLNSLEIQYLYQGYDLQNPVPPPRRRSRKGQGENSNSPNMENDRRPNRYLSQANFNIPPRSYRMTNSQSVDRFKRRSTESLKSVEESSEADSELNVKAYRKSELTLLKSPSGYHLYLQNTSDGALPMSPQSKYSLSSSRDSVLSDSSGSYLNRQNSPEPMSSSAETPDQEDSGMSEWLSHQSKHVMYSGSKHLQRRISHDDSEVGLKIDKKPVSKVNYLISPKTSPKLQRRSPIPLEARRSFPLQPTLVQRGSGSNTSKEAEDIIKSPKLSVIYCSQEGLDRHDVPHPKDKQASPHLDIYNNNAFMKQLTMYGAGLQGSSPPPRVVLQGLSSQSQAAKPSQNMPVRGNHFILTAADFANKKQKYPMEEASVSSEDEDDGDSDEVETYRVQTILPNVPLRFNTSKPLIEHHKSASDSSSHSEDTVKYRPENPPAYDVAVHRNRLLKQGLSPDKRSDDEIETERQREASLRAKQLYEESIRQFQERQLVSQAVKQEPNIVSKNDSVSSDESETASCSSEEEEPKYNPHKIYEESLKRFHEEQLKSSPLTVDGKNISLLQTKGDELEAYSGVKVGLSAANSNPKSESPSHSRTSSGSSKTSSNESTPTARPIQPPPYNNPPPYHSQQKETSPGDARRHLFPTADDSAVLVERSVAQGTQQTVNARSDVFKSSNQNAHSAFGVPKRRDNILVSNRSRTNVVNSVDRLRGPNVSHSADFSVQSAPKEAGSLYRANVTNIRACAPPTQVKTVNPSSDAGSQPGASGVLKPRASSVEPSISQTVVSKAVTDTQGPISYRNPQFSKSSTSMNVVKSVSSVPPQRERRSSVDGSSNRPNPEKDLPWSVKRLSNIFDTVKVDGKSSSANSSPVSTTTLLSSTKSSPSFASSSRSTPSHDEQTNFILSDTVRSSMSSNSSSRSSLNQSRNSVSPVKKFGPLARDSFSSSDSSECSCRYSLSCRRDNDNLEELSDASLTDITYV